MTESLHLTYDLKIRARKVYINKPLTMEMDMEKFKSEQKYHTVFSKQFQFKANLYIPSAINTDYILWQLQSTETLILYLICPRKYIKNIHKSRIL